MNTTTDAAQATATLTDAALSSARLGNGAWVHRPAPALNPARPLQPGESARINGRWVHGPQVGASR
jgi:hypothetical protein